MDHTHDPTKAADLVETLGAVELAAVLVRDVTHPGHGLHEPHEAADVGQVRARRDVTVHHVRLAVPVHNLGTVTLCKKQTRRKRRPIVISTRYAGIVINFNRTPHKFFFLME